MGVINEIDFDRGMHAEKTFADFKERFRKVKEHEREKFAQFSLNK